MNQLSFDFLDEPREPPPRFPKVRDFQRSKVYSAERSSFDFWSQPRGDLLDFQIAHQYVVEIWTSEFVRQWWPIAITKPVPRVVRKSRGYGGSSYYVYRNEIRLGMLSKFVILHEIAHALADIRGHGETFAGTLLALVKHFLGEHRGRRLRQEFKNHGVKWNQQKGKRRKP